MRQDWSFRGISLLLVIVTLCIGCAHHRQSPYAYAPPYAPPVYTQPQTQVAPVASPAAPVVVAPALPSAGYVPPGGGPTATATGFSQVLPAGAVMASGPPCPPTCDPCTAGGMVMPVGYEQAVQTQPCPPGP
jgi:hypothetical protein